jgi:hypothetical protein
MLRIAGLQKVKRNSIIRTGLALCGIAAIVLFTFHWRCSYTSKTKTYATLEHAITEEAISLGWLPDFLPASAHDIHEKRHAEGSRVIAAFSVSSTEDVKQMLSRARELPGSHFPDIRPSVICRKEQWFPMEIIRGRFDELTPRGFKIYEIISGPMDETIGAPMTHWYLAVHEEAGICYLWTNVDGRISSQRRNHAERKGGRWRPTMSSRLQQKCMNSRHDPRNGVARRPFFPTVFGNVAFKPFPGKQDPFDF